MGLLMSDGESEITIRTEAPEPPGDKQGHAPWKLQHYAWCCVEGVDDTVYEPIDQTKYPQRLAPETIDTDEDPRGPRGTILPAEDDNKK